MEWLAAQGGRIGPDPTQSMTDSILARVDAYNKANGFTSQPGDGDLLVGTSAATENLPLILSDPGFRRWYRGIGYTVDWVPVIPGG